MTKYASGRHSIAECDVCGFRFMLTELRPIIIKDKLTNIMACSACWTPDQPQLHLGEFPVDDPQAVRNPRPDLSYPQSRDIQWGWNPVGGGNGVTTPNTMVAVARIGTVTVV